jgi:hypothetical protein
MLASSNPIIDYPGNLHYFISSLVFKLGKWGGYVWIGSGLFFVSLLIFLALTHLNSDKSVYLPRKYLHSEAFFLLAIFLSILILRLPNLILFEQNPDESQMISSAATLLKDFRFWLSVDGVSCGPLAYFPLTLIYVFAGSLNYATVRLFGLLFCIIPSVIFVYLAFRSLFDERIAGVIILPLVVCMCFINFWDIIAYNGEHVAMLLISIGIFLYGRMVTSSDKRQLLYLFFLGFALGFVPYAKLQSVPIALGIGIFCCIDLLLNCRRNKKKGLGALAIFILSGLTPSILVLSYLLDFGIFEDFWQSYILTNLAYAQQGLSEGAVTWFYKISILPLLIWTTPHTRYYFISLFMSALVSGFILFRFRSFLESIDYRLTFLSLLITLTSYYCIVQPGNFFHHYQILFIIPALFFSGVLIGILYKKKNMFQTLLIQFHLSFSTSRESTPRPKICFDVRLRRILLISFVSIAVAIPSFYTLSIGSEGIKYAKGYAKGYRIYRKYAKTYGYAKTYPMMYEKSEVAKKISEFARLNERMAIWGWMNRYYVETGLLQGTREAHSYYQITMSEQQDYYLKRYVSDLIQNKPVVFVDAVAPKSFYFNNPAQRHENFPILKAVIDTDYAFVAEIEGVRIYYLENRRQREKTSSSGETKSLLKNKERRKLPPHEVLDSKWVKTHVCQGHLRLLPVNFLKYQSAPRDISSEAAQGNPFVYNKYSAFEDIGWSPLSKEFMGIIVLERPFPNNGYSNESPFRKTATVASLGTNSSNALSGS